jgi:hypothetical protein
MTILEIKISEKEKKNEKNKKKENLFNFKFNYFFLKILNKCYMIIPIYQIIQ